VTAEIFNPRTGGVSTAANQTANARLYGSAVTLGDGRVLVTGGTTYFSTYYDTADLFDPRTNSFTATGPMTLKRVYHRSILLPNGKVLLVGGENSTNGSENIANNNAELYDPDSGTFTAVPGTIGPQSTSAARYHSLTLLPTGKVLIAGVYSASSALKAAFLYDPVTNSFSATSDHLTPRGAAAQVLLPSGLVLCAGGMLAPQSTTTLATTSELYDPWSGTFTTTGALATPRARLDGVLLPNGKVLATSGATAAYLDNADLYSAGAFTPTGPLSVARRGPAVLLRDGRVALLSGYGGTGAPTIELYR
jgi:hypothetical protein